MSISRKEASKIAIENIKAMSTSELIAALREKQNSPLAVTIREISNLIESDIELNYQPQKMTAMKLSSNLIFSNQEFYFEDGFDVCEAANEMLAA